MGRFLTCPNCDADLEVTSLNPLEPDWTECLVNEDQDQLRELELVPA